MLKNIQLENMSNMKADVFLVSVSDAVKLKRLQKYLDEKYTIIYVNVNHSCPKQNENYLTQDHVKLVVYSDMYYEKLVAMVIGDNATILPQDVTDDYRLDTMSALIGFCICNQQTQGDIATYEMA